MTHNVFISYSHQDKPIADAVCANIENAGMRCWIAPRDIAPRLDRPSAITNAISECQVMILIFSTHSNSSSDIGRQLILAADNNLAIVPFRLDDITPAPGKQYYLARTHWLDAMNPPTQEQIDALVGTVRAFLVEKGVHLAPPKEAAGEIKRPVPRKQKNKKNTKLVWITVISLLGIAVLASGVFFLPHLASPAPATTTPSPSLTHTLVLSPTSSPTPTTTPLPDWVTSFAQPILDFTSTHPENMRGSTSEGPWTITSIFYDLDYSIADDSGEVTINWGRWTVWYTDFVIDMDIKIPSQQYNFWLSFRNWHGLGFNYDGSFSIPQPENKFPINAIVPETIWNRGDFNHYTIIVSDYSEAIYVNDQPIYFGDLEKIKTGECYWTGAIFDNIRIWDLSKMVNP
jgi:hypothetical protein